jgi:glycosyltransferase involved in cell wall biosynthesis
LRLPKLTVVIPTRDRPASLLRLLDALEGQSLDPASFEVVVVDDGSALPLDQTALAANRRYSLRVLRRDRDPSAHNSRAAGAAAARGARVLFLDDDVEPDPDVLASHAGVPAGFAVGLIFYHPDTSTTPYLRLQSRLYAAYAQRLLDGGPSMPIAELYICNASGPAREFARVLEAARSIYGEGAVPGDGCDEELMDVALQQLHGGTASVLRDATVWHRDTKTIAQARRERRRRGMTICRLLLERPDLRAHFPETATIAGRRGWYRSARIRLLFATPRLHRAASNLCSYVAAWPSRFVPAKVCYPPLAIDFWEGFRAVSPSFRRLRTAVSGSSP